MSEAFQLITSSSPEYNRKPPFRTDDPGLWTDVQADQLVNLLEDMDGLKHEIHERMRRIEAVKQAKSVLREDALRTEALNQKLACIRESLSQAHAAPNPREEAGLLQMPAREISAMILPPSIDPTPLSEHSLPSERIEDAASLRQVRAAEPLSPKQSEQPTNKPANAPVSQEMVTAGLNQPSDPAQAADALPRPTSTQANDFARELSAISIVATEASEAFRSAKELLARSEEARMLADKSVLEARQILEQSFTQLSHAIVKEEKAAAELNSTQQELTTAYQFAAAAAQRQHNAAEFFRKTNHWTVNAAALAWVATIWTVWVSFHTRMQVWAPCLATAAVMALAVIMARWSTRNDS